MAGIFNFGELIVQAMENEKNRQFENRKLSNQEKQFQMSMNLEQDKLSQQNEQFKTSQNFEVEKWLGGQKQLIQKQIALVEAQGKEIPETLRLKQLQIDTDIQQFKDQMGFNNKQLDANIQLKRDEMAQDKQLRMMQIGQSGAALNFEKEKWNYIKQEQAKKTEFKVNPQTGKYQFMKSDGKPLGWNDFVSVEAYSEFMKYAIQQPQVVKDADGNEKIIPAKQILFPEPPKNYMMSSHGSDNINKYNGFDNNNMFEGMPSTDATGKKWNYNNMFIK